MIARGSRRLLKKKRWRHCGRTCVSATSNIELRTTAACISGTGFAIEVLLNRGACLAEIRAVMRSCYGNGGPIPVVISCERGIYCVVGQRYTGDFRSMSSVTREELSLLRLLGTTIWWDTERAEECYCVTPTERPRARHGGLQKRQLL